MDWLTFVADIVGSIAWPLVVVILGFAFRDKLSSILTELRKIKVGGVEAEFGERTREVEEVAGRIEDGGPEASLLGMSPGEAEERLRETARNTPRGAILEAWLLVETASIDLLKEIGNHEFKSHPGPTRIRDFLVKQDVLSAAQRTVFERLRELRNDAVHVADASISVQDANRYIDSAVKLSFSLNNRRRLSQ